MQLEEKQETRYETQGAQPNGDALKSMAMVFGITIDFLVNGTTVQKAENAITDSKLIGLFKQIENLETEDRQVVAKLIESFAIKKNGKDAQELSITLHHLLNIFTDNIEL